jgi:hypothetical protein
VRVDDVGNEMNRAHIKEDRVMFAMQTSDDKITRRKDTVKVDTSTEPPVYAQSPKSRTFSMQMRDAIGALHREEDEVSEVEDKQNL